MRPVDIVALLVVAVAALAVFLPRHPLPGGWRHLPTVALVVAGAHLAVAFRPFFIPLYGLALLTALGANPRSRDRVWMRRLAGLGGIVPLAAGGALAWAFPLVSLPRPDGPFAIGTRDLALTDTTRAEDLTAEPGDRRTLLVRVWYPADSAAGAAQPLFTRERARALAGALGVPRFVLDHLASTPTHSHPDAPLSTREARWPVVLFSHGYGIGYEAQNTGQMEALASHGYVVASILHPWESLATRLPDGRVAAAVPEPPLPAGADSARIMATFARLGTERDTAALVQVIRDAHAVRDLGPSMDRWTADTRFVLDELTRRGAPGAADSLFTGRLATDHVGIFGMSFGGATAATFCTIDARCAGGMNLDGLTFGEAATTVPMPRPFFFVTGAPNREMHTLFFQRATAPAWSMTVARTQHLDFTDFGWFSPLPARVGMLGGIEPARMHAIMNDAVLGFFGNVLRGQPMDPQRLTRHADVTLTRRAP
jgi:predicted dienelactone hydrolase